MFYVYFLELENGDFYVGSTPDLRRRLQQHRSGYVKSTRRYQPSHLRCYVAVGSETSCRTLERYFKSGSGKAFAFRHLLVKS